MKHDKKHIGFIILFLIVLILPTLVQMTGVEDIIVNNENRKKNDFPKFQTKKPFLFVRKFKAYYKDNFGLRNTLSNSYLDFKNSVLHESPLPSKVIMGKSNFMFLGNSYSNVVNESLGFEKFSDKKLEKIKNNILSRKKWLKENDISFYIAVAPNKHVVYKENLPFKFLTKTTRKQQLLKYIKSKINFNIIDLGQQFTLKKKKHRLYRKYDSHWNDLGAFYAAQTLVSEIKKEYDIENLKLTNYKIDSVKSNGGISKTINYKTKEMRLVLKPRHKDSMIDLATAKYYSDPTIYESRYKNPSKKIKVLLFRDSFSSALIPFLNHTFGETTFIWSHNFDKDLILKEKPDIVIMEYVERYIERM